MINNKNNMSRSKSPSAEKMEMSERALDRQVLACSQLATMLAVS